MSNATVAPSTGDLLAILGDQEKARDVFGDPEKAKAWGDDFAKAKAKEYTDLEAKITAAAEAKMVEMLNDDIRKPSFEKSAPVRNKYYNPKSDGAKVEGIVDGLGEFCQAIYHDQRDVELQAKAAKIRNTLSTTVPASGGTLVPESIRSDLMAIQLENSVVRPNATVIPMDAPRVKQPIIDSTSNASTVYGGITVYSTAEEAALTASNPTFGEIILDANKLTASCYASGEMIQDSAVSVQGLLGQRVPEAIAFKEDSLFIRGTGTGEPLGFLNAPAVVEVAKETGQLADTIVWENLVEMWSRLLPGSHGNAVWIANHDCIRELATMALSVGTGGAPVWVANGAQALPQTLLGRPLYFSEKMSTLGDAGDIALVDLSYYMIGDRQQLTAATSNDYKFMNDQVTFRFIERIDGRPAILSAITPNQSSDTLSAFVTLAARA